jgi:hypothetical protein
MLTTAKVHFNEDLARATELLDHARPLQNGMLRDDILRGAWMMAVGASDAYFCDAHGDLIARTLRAKSLQTAVVFPDRLNNLRVPVIAVLGGTHEGWRWRMAARELIEDKNVLSLKTIRELFNHFFRPGCRILNKDTIEPWILHPRAKSRLFGITPTKYRKVAPPQKADARRLAWETFDAHFADLFQRRHDCIHNCDRPKIAVQRIADPTVRKTLEDIDFLVSRCHDAFRTEFPVYLTGLGFTAAVRNQVCQ